MFKGNWRRHEASIQAEDGTWSTRCQSLRSECEQAGMSRLFLSSEARHHGALPIPWRKIQGQVRSRSPVRADDLRPDLPAMSACRTCIGNGCDALVDDDGRLYSLQRVLFPFVL